MQFSLGRRGLEIGGEPETGDEPGCLALALEVGNVPVLRARRNKALTSSYFRWFAQWGRRTFIAIGRLPARL